ncbi:hypothetical protein G7068_13805 [Leucobacter viscericola]|uniref:Uncharacterized protein n=1 Tax=Leucobacter viscericola TaxID=2714935 RepID=A0A6G7XHR3_9MICO|nr:hypothetical protein [Leucobacter viscericola]QIK63842.1 hypothetical protein G7068_12050 [Leucobacter viscericola]QIK64154.1 hypothetical protein G7068_13805 [Leucobacter viscericola]
MAKIYTPVKGFTGNVAGVDFVNGEAETDDPRALAYFERHGYKVESGKRPRAKTEAVE